MISTVILTVVGSDRPGLVETLADAVLAAGGNWLESHLSHLAGRFVGAVLVEVPATALDGLRQRLQKADSAGLTVTLVEAGPTPESVATPIQLDLVGQDRPGIVREVTRVLAGLGVNIGSFTTELVHGAWSGERLFKARAALLIPDSLKLDQLQAALEDLSGEIMVDIRLGVPDRRG